MFFWLMLSDVKKKETRNKGDAQVGGHNMLCIYGGAVFF